MKVRPASIALFTSSQPTDRSRRITARSPDATLLAIAAGSCVNIWQQGSTPPVHLATVDVPKPGVAGITWHARHNILFIASSTAQRSVIAVHDLSDPHTPELLLELRCIGAVHALAPSPDGNHLAVASDAAITLWDVAGGRVTLQIPHGKGRVEGLEWAADERHLTAMTACGLCVWDTHDITSPVSELGFRGRGFGGERRLVARRLPSPVTERR